MPIYEYTCRACGVETEIMHKISDPPVRKCPACGKLKLTKLVSAAGFRLGGGGWYETDFKKDGKRNIAGDKAEPAAASAPAAADKGGAAKAEPAKTPAGPSKTPNKKSDKPSTKAAAPA